MIYRQAHNYKNHPTAEDDMYFDKALDLLRSEINKGRTLAQAGRVLTWMNGELKNTVLDEFIKIIIAEQHFGGGRGIDDIALFLDIPYEKVEGIKRVVEKELSLFLPYMEDPAINLTTH
ncbi:MAG: hypothetical protein KAR13_18160 [Desulfobulbaceae bacterium]|nr:hypothetical protein [Desulfobulbaceae bacterium]MCK5324166.1 hypothetical protein [Desulfobulbaceae bacterium]MCK5545163.1 hypothetical protein [Desulfobulbaceae bacterium]